MSKMQLVLECPKCMARFNLKKHVPEKRVRCRKCQEPMMVPHLPWETPPAAQAPSAELTPEVQATLKKAFPLRKLALVAAALVVVSAAAAVVLIYRLKAQQFWTSQPVAETPMTFSKVLEENKKAPYPAAIGMEWFLAGPGGTIEMRVIESRVGSENQPQYEFTVSDGAPHRQLVRFTNEGVLLLETTALDGSKTTYEPPLRFVSRPLGIDGAWKCEGQVTSREGTGPYSLDFKALGAESITTPVGTFQCVRLKITGTMAGRVVDETRWYALGTGLVRVSAGGKEFTLQRMTRP